MNKFIDAAMNWLLMAVFLILVSLMVVTWAQTKDEEWQSRHRISKIIWGHWVEYRDSSCKLTQKVYNAPTSGNKPNTNLIGYECANGITYYVMPDLDMRVKLGDLKDLKAIPRFPF